MEKVIGALWKGEGETRDAFNARLLSDLPAALCDAGASRVRINLRDHAVEPASALIQTWQSPQQDAIVQFWMPSANARFRANVDAALGRHCARFALWLVAESTIIANTAHTPRPGARTWGWSQASFISFTGNRTRHQCLDHWHRVHTAIGVDTQANFEYVQHPIIRALTDDAPAYDAFIEECFPPEAMSDQRAFYDAGSDEAKYRANLNAMMASCAEFIDFSRIDIIPTSQFDFTGEQT